MFTAFIVLALSVILPYLLLEAVVALLLDTAKSEIYNGRFGVSAPRRRTSGFL